MKKGLINFAFIFILLFVFISCSNKGSAEINKAPQVPAPKPITLPTKKVEPSEISLRFAVMADCRGSDNGVNSKAVTKTLEEIKKLSPQPSFAIMPGDLVGGSFSYSEVKSQLQHFRNLITAYYPIQFFYPGFGNHEATAGIKGEEAFEEVFPEINASFFDGYRKTVYFFDKGSSRFYMLNSNNPGEDHQISDIQLNFVKANLDNQKKQNFYFFHEPAFPTGAHIGSSLDVNKYQRDKLWSMIDSSNHPMVFCGHEHNYTRRHIDSSFNETVNNQAFNFNKLVYQVTTGTFGAPIYESYKDSKNVDVPPIGEYHFAIVDIANNKVIVTTYNLDSKVIDYFEQ